MEEKRFRFGESGCIVCDPCYVLNDDDYQNVWGKEHNFADGIIEDIMMVAPTGGDGCYETQYVEPNHTFFLPVDSGSIAIVNKDSECYDSVAGAEIALSEEGISFDGSGWGEITNVDDKYLSVYLEFDDGRTQDFTIQLADEDYEIEED